MPTETLLAEIADGQGEPLGRLARRVPSTRRNRPTTLSCLVRWVLQGVKGPDGRRIKLEAARLAGRWISTPAALQRFIANQTPRLDDAAPPTPRSPGKRQRASEAAAKRLDAIGI